MTGPIGGSTGPAEIGRRTVLVVTYYFPPLGGVGVQRTLKFVRNLPAEGWRAVVVAPADPAYPLRDPGLLPEIPDDVEVVRTPCPEPAGLARWLAGRLGHRTSAGSPATPVTARDRTAAAVGTPAIGRWRPGPLLALLRTGAAWWTRLARIVLFPDDQVLWWPFAVRAGQRVHARGRVDAIYSSSPPVTAHLIARSLRRATGRPWVADFRDPWVGNAFASRPSPLKGRLRAWLERRIVEGADRVIVVSPSMRTAFAARYPKRAERIICIPNGYDRSELGGIVPVPREPGRFTLVYSGSVYGDRELSLFLDGVERLLARRPELRERLRIEFVGRINVTNQRIAERYATPARLGEIVTYTGFVSRREALGRMRSADALLQLIADDPDKEAVVGAKVPEYLGFDLPILAVVPRGDARAILEELDWGIVADPEPEAIELGIERLLAAPKPARPADPEGRYDRVTQARHLAAILDKIAHTDGRC